MSAKKKTLEIDSGMKGGLDAFMVGKAGPAPEKTAPPETVPATEKGTKRDTPARAPKAKKKKSLLTKKQGLYFSEKLDERIDKEWRSQARGSRKSKSLLVENILREYWKLPPMEE